MNAITNISKELLMGTWRSLTIGQDSAVVSSQASQSRGTRSISYIPKHGLSTLVSFWGQKSFVGLNGRSSSSDILVLELILVRDLIHSATLNLVLVLF